MDIESSRPSELNRVMKWFDSAGEPGTVDIYGISGFGGIGKSYLLREVLKQVNPDARGFLKIQIDGSDESILRNFMAIYDGRFAPRSIPKGKHNYDYFPHARRLVSEYTKLDKKVREEVEKTSSSDAVKAAAKMLFRGGAILNSAMPKTKEYLDFDAMQKLGVGEYFDEALDLVGKLKSLQTSSFIPGVMKDITGISYHDGIKNSLYKRAADEWVADLCAILNRYRRKDRFKWTHSPIDGLNRLLLIIDDFEILGKTIMDFVTIELIPSLEQANFHTTLIFVGRDDISDAHISFNHHFSHLVKDRIRLERFPNDVSERLFLAAGHDHAEIEKLMGESMGYPFLVNLLCEAKGGSVSFYQKFYDRTTRWMAPAERKWVMPLCYLDRVTEESVAKMIPDTAPETVVQWFKNEASLRDPNATWYAISPYIRRTLIELHRREIGSKKSDELIEKGRQASLDA